MSPPAGPSHEEIHAVADPARLADFMHPGRGVYFDALHGTQDGAAAARRLVADPPARVPVFPPLLFSDALGSVSMTEWETAGDAPLKGISVRRMSGPWIDYAADYYDTGPARRMAFEQGLALPEWPRSAPDVDDGRPRTSLSAAALDWLASRRALRAGGGWSVSSTVTEPSGLGAEDMHAILNDRSTEREFDIICDLMHPTGAVYVDPIFGVFQGQARIREWLTDIMGKVGKASYVPVGAPLLKDGVSFQEWRQVAPLPDGGEIVMSRGASVRRFEDGWMTYAADYFDTAPMLDPDVQAASKEAGSTVTIEDVLRYVRPPAS